VARAMTGTAWRRSRPSAGRSPRQAPRPRRAPSALPRDGIGRILVAVDHLVERLAAADHAELAARDLLDRVEPGLEIAHFGRQRAVALAQPLVLLRLRRDLVVEPPGGAVTVIRHPKAQLQQDQQR